MTSIEAGKTVVGERADLLETLARHRALLRGTVRGLTDEQAAQRTTVSELCLGGLIKHVSATERGWASFIVGGAAATRDAAGGEDWGGRIPNAGRGDAGRAAGRVRGGSAGPMSSWLRCRIWTAPTRCPRPPGSSRARAGRRGASCCT